MNVKKQKELDNQQRSTLTYSIDHMVLVEGKRSEIIPMSGHRLENKGGNPEYLCQ